MQAEMKLLAGEVQRAKQQAAAQEQRAVQAEHQSQRDRFKGVDWEGLCTRAFRAS
jgi:hypothetical protein